MATRTAAPGLSADELARIRDTLAAGRKPKVVFTAAAGQIAGQVGQVVELTDPELSDEWVVVRFGHDELPFSPADLQIPAKSRPAARPAAAAAPPLAVAPLPREEPSVPSSTTTVNGAARPAKGVKASPPPAVTTAPAGSAPATVPAPESAAGRPAPPVKAPPTKAEPMAPAGASAGASAQPGGSGGGGSAAGGSGGSGAGGGTSAAKPARKAARPKTPASLTVTLTYTDGEWMVGATQGAKALAKPYVIRPSEALKMVSLLDVPGVHEAVDEIVSAARTEAEQQAERLRAELAEVESRLAELRDAG